LSDFELRWQNSLPGQQQATKLATNCPDRFCANFPLTPSQTRL
jgi:hypothetical protein